MDKSKIEWTDATVNPVSGCTRVSEGCRNCYAERISARFGGLVRNGRWTGEVELHPERLAQFLRWRKPRRIFVNSMSDTFHDRVPNWFLDRLFATMALAPQHTFQVLTKRPKRAQDYFTDWLLPTRLLAARSSLEAAYRRTAPSIGRWPLPNLWLGTSIEDQKTAEERIPYLREIPAGHRFLSLEPMLGPVNMTGLLDRIDLVIVGGESGPGARPLELEWVRAVLAACSEAGVARFVKQLGSATAKRLGLKGKAGEPAEWPEDLRIREGFDAQR